jgi:O-succinylbenzoate synthase
LANIGGMNGGKIDTLRVRRRFRRPLLTGRGPVDAVDRLLLRTETDEGVGYGELAPWPGFPTETIDQAVEVVRSAQGNLGRLQAVAEAAGDTLPCLRAALSSCAHWSEIAAYAGNLACAGLAEATIAAVRAKSAEGFTTVKVKLAGSGSPDDVRAILAAVPAVRLRLDANGGLDLAAARAWTELARAEARIDFLEQPLPVGHPGYASLGPDKVALDESFLTPAGIDWTGPVVVKPSLVGDWDAFRAWRATRVGPVVYSSAFETAIGRQAALWLAAQDPAAGAVGFDTLGRFELDGRDRHAGGPMVCGALDLRWADFWNELA